MTCTKNDIVEYYIYSEQTPVTHYSVNTMCMHAAESYCLHSEYRKLQNIDIHNINLKKYFQ